MKSCRNCKWAYLRTEETKHYNYEACALGCITMIQELPDDMACDLWEQRSGRYPDDSGGNTNF